MFSNKLLLFEAKDLSLNLFSIFLYYNYLTKDDDEQSLVFSISFLLLFKVRFPLCRILYAGMVRIKYMDINASCKTLPSLCMDSW